MRKNELDYIPGRYLQNFMGRQSKLDMKKVFEEVYTNFCATIGLATCVHYTVDFFTHLHCGRCPPYTVASTSICSLGGYT